MAKTVGALLLLNAFFFTAKTYASLAEMFAASATSAALSGQAFTLPSHTANNYYLPALLDRSSRPLFSLTTSYVIHQFRPIEDVLIRNRYNSDGNETQPYADVSTNYDALPYGALHLQVPLTSSGEYQWGLSVLAPVKELLKINTGDPFLPEYTMYRSRNHRTSLYANLVGPLSSHYRWSLGLHAGIGIYAKVFMNITIEDTPGESDTQLASYAQTISSASPKVAGIASIARTNENMDWGFKYQQKMQSDLIFDIQGGVTDPKIPFKMTVTSLAYYDPHILSFYYHQKWKNFGLQTTLEYQIWKSYLPPTIKVAKQARGNIEPSKTLASLNPVNIWLPKFGAHWLYSPKHRGLLGLAYRPSPLPEAAYLTTRNAIDCDKIITSIGHRYQTRSFGKTLHLSLALQYHHLLSFRVEKEKTLTQRNIGHPSYRVGGNLFNTALELALDL